MFDKFFPDHYVASTYVIDFEKLNKFDMKVFCTIIDKLEKTDNNQVQLNNMASIYSNELAQHNFSDSILNLFLHK